MVFSVFFVLTIARRGRGVVFDVLQIVIIYLPVGSNMIPSTSCRQSEATRRGTSRSLEPFYMRITYLLCLQILMRSSQYSDRLRARSGGDSGSQVRESMGFGSASILSADRQGKVGRDRERLMITILIFPPLTWRNSFG